MKATTSIPTSDAKKIAKRLLNHWKHKFEVDELHLEDQRTVYSIMMPDALVRMVASTDLLIVELDTKREDYKVLEKVVIDHLNRMAHQEFNVEWEHE